MRKKTAPPRVKHRKTSASEKKSGLIAQKKTTGSSERPESALDNRSHRTQGASVSSRKQAVRGGEPNTYPAPSPGRVMLFVFWPFPPERSISPRHPCDQGLLLRRPLAPMASPCIPTSPTSHGTPHCAVVQKPTSPPHTPISLTTTPRTPFVRPILCRRPGIETAGALRGGAPTPRPARTRRRHR